MANIALTDAYLGGELTVVFPALAAANIAETGADWTTDLHDLRTAQISAESLLAKCLDGADADRAQGWLEYVETLESAARG